MTKEQNKDKKDRKITVWLVVAIVLVLVIWFLGPMVINLCYDAPAGAGEFGDSFGAINALFTALAFAFLIYTSLMQKEELEMQRKELEMTREELKKSAEAQAELVKLTKEQLSLQHEAKREREGARFEIEATKTNPAGEIEEVTLKVVNGLIRLTDISFSYQEKVSIDVGEIKWESLSYYGDTTNSGGYYEVGAIINVDVRPIHYKSQSEPFRVKVNFYDAKDTSFKQAMYLGEKGAHLSPAYDISYLY